MFEGVAGSRKARAIAAGLAMLVAVIALCSLASVKPSFALKAGGASDFSLGGNATVLRPGNGSPTGAQLAATANSESHVNIAIPSGLKLNELSNLSTDYKFALGTCLAGSPRFTANVKRGGSTGSVFFYIGPPCGLPDWVNTGNLATSASLADARSLPGGSIEPYSNVKSKYGDYAVTAVHIDVDGGASGNQTVDFDNTTVNAKLVTYEPQHGISVLMERTAGTIKVKEPGKKAKRGFRRFKKVESVRVNSVVDTTGGKVQVTAATGNFGETTPDNSVSFYDGLIRIVQKGKHNAPATAKLAGKLQCPRRAAGASASKASGPLATTSRKRRRRVWGSGSGNYGTAGGGGTGSVRGTTWLTKDTCRGTFFRVTEGLGIIVRDFGLHKKVPLGPGQAYFARIR